MPTRAEENAVAELFLLPPQVFSWVKVLSSEGDLRYKTGHGADLRRDAARTLVSWVSGTFVAHGGQTVLIGGQPYSPIGPERGYTGRPRELLDASGTGLVLLSRFSERNPRIVLVNTAGPKIDSVVLVAGWRAGTSQEAIDLLPTAQQRLRIAAEKIHTDLHRYAGAKPFRW